MSLSLIAWKPRIDEPSNPSPSPNTLSVSSFRGSEKCCQVPGRSVKRPSTICTPASFALRITSAGVGALPGLAVAAAVKGSIGGGMDSLSSGALVGDVGHGPYHKRREPVGGLERRALDGAATSTKRQACGKVEAPFRTVKLAAHDLQPATRFHQKHSQKTSQRHHSCAHHAAFSTQRVSRRPPGSATAPPPKTPRNAPGSPAPKARGRSTRSPGAAPRSRSAAARARRRPRHRAGPRGTPPSARRRASARPCAWRAPDPGMGRSLPLNYALPHGILPVRFPLPMNCHVCGAALGATAKFCHKCGAALGIAQSTGWRAGRPSTVAGASGGALLLLLVLRLAAWGPRGANPAGADAAGPDAPPAPPPPPPPPRSPPASGPPTSRRCPPKSAPGGCLIG